MRRPKSKDLSKADYFRLRYSIALDNDRLEKAWYYRTRLEQMGEALTEEDKGKVRLELTQAELKLLHTVCQSWIRMNEMTKERDASVKRVRDLKNKVVPLIEL